MIARTLIGIFLLTAGGWGLSSGVEKETNRSFPKTERSGFFMGLNTGFGLLALPEIESQTATVLDLRLGWALTQRFILAGSLAGGMGITRDFDATGGDFYTGNFNWAGLQILGIVYPFRTRRGPVKNFGLTFGMGSQNTAVQPSDPLIYEAGLMAPVIEPEGNHPVQEDTSLTVSLGWTADFQLSHSFHLSLESDLKFVPESRLPLVFSLLLGFKWF